MREKRQILTKTTGKTTVYAFSGNKDECSRPLGSNKITNNILAYWAFKYEKYGVARKFSKFFFWFLKNIKKF